MQKGGGEPPKGSFGGAIDSQFGTLEALVQKMNAEGAALQGSGWVVCSTNHYLFHGPFGESLKIQCLPVAFSCVLDSGLVWTKN